jgi:hypothetical protein
MKSKEPADLLSLEQDLPTTAEDIRALREHRPRASADWWNELTSLSEQAGPSAEALRRRPTFAGCEPFEL